MLREHHPGGQSLSSKRVMVKLVVKLCRRSVGLHKPVELDCRGAVKRAAHPVFKTPPFFEGSNTLPAKYRFERASVVYPSENSRRESGFKDQL